MRCLVIGLFLFAILSGAKAKAHNLDLSKNVPRENRLLRMDKLVENECSGLKDEWDELKNILKEKGVDLTEPNVIQGAKSKPQPEPKPEPKPEPAPVPIPKPAPKPEPSPEPAPAPAPVPAPQGGYEGQDLKKVRWDRRCGPNYRSIQDGISSGECDPNSPNPCCSEYGWCGPESDYNKQDHCSCANCVDFRKVYASGGSGGSAGSAGSAGSDGSTGTQGGGSVGFNSPGATWRFDRRCGPDYPLADGSPSECDPDGSVYCCSKWGWCGPDANDGEDHCTGGTDYRYKRTKKE